MIVHLFTTWPLLFNSQMTLQQIHFYCGIVESIAVWFALLLTGESPVYHIGVKPGPTWKKSYTALGKLMALSGTNLIVNIASLFLYHWEHVMGYLAHVQKDLKRLRNIFLPRAGRSDLSSVLVTSGPLTTHPAHENKGC